MANNYYPVSGTPAQNSDVRSALMRAEFLAIEDGFDKLPAFSGNAGKMVVVNGSGNALTVSGLTLPASGTLATVDQAETFTNKRFTHRTATLADAVAITPNGDTTDLALHINTQGLGTLTVNAPTGTPTGLQRLMLRIKSAQAHALAFNAIYRGSADKSLPAALTGANKWDYILFTFNSADTKWDLSGLVKGFG